MPEVWFHVCWPDESRTTCYSPSSAVTDYLDTDTEYRLDEFLRRTREALMRSSERVRERYGFACSSAADQLAVIEQTALQFADKPGACVRIERFE